MLKTIEQMTGKPISELFDWVVGTSTGGILALGMIYGRPVEAAHVSHFAYSCCIQSLYVLVIYDHWSSLSGARLWCIGAYLAF